MSIFTAIGIAVVLLYSWLVGHWFARVLMFLLLAVVMGLGGGALFAAIAAVPNATGPFVVGAILGVPLAWPLAGIPIYYQRHQFNKWLLGAR